MRDPDEPNTGTPSTQWGWRKVKIQQRRQAHAQSAAKPHRWKYLPRRDPRLHLTLKVAYRGGAECWYIVEARGSAGMFPGHKALHDVLTEITNADRPERPPKQ